MDHHFDFKLDGHKRKYTLHCVATNKTHYDVYLVRAADGFRIPYSTVNGASFHHSLIKDLYAFALGIKIDQRIILIGTLY